MQFQTATALLFGLLASAAQAADPTATIVSSSDPVTFGAYAGSKVVGEGRVNIDELFFIDEQAGALGKSWYLFFEPAGKPQPTIDATITFDSAISLVYTTKAELDGSNSQYGAAGINYSSDATLVGLEKSDSYSFSGNTLTVHLTSDKPGDHLRIFTSPVPEPSTWALMVAGLLAVGYVTGRRQT